MKKYTIILLLFLSCNTSKLRTVPDMIGVYETKNIRTFEDRFLGRTRVIGERLELYNDNMFKYRTCSTISIGLWKKNGEELELLTMDETWRIDSLNYVPRYIKRRKQTQKFHYTTTFQIKGASLIKVYKTTKKKLFLELFKVKNK